MTKKVITYICDITPNHLTAHSVFREVTELQQVGKFDEFKVQVKDNTIILIIDENLDKNQAKELVMLDKITEKKITCYRVSEKTLDSSSQQSFQKDEMFNVSGLISWAICKPDGKKQCPITVKNTIDKLKTTPEEREYFRQTLEKITGVKLENLEHATFIRTVIDETKLDDKETKQKLFLNVFWLSYDGLVINPEQAKKSQVTSFGRNRSYGFGNIKITKI